MKEHLLDEIGKRKQEIHYFKRAILSIDGMEKAGTLERNTALARLVIVDGRTVPEAAAFCKVDKSGAKHIVAAICKQMNPLLYAAGPHSFDADASLDFLRDNAQGFFAR